MATRDDIYAAIRNADKAGDTASVQKLAAYLQTMPPDAAADAPAPDPTNGVAALGAGLGKGFGQVVLNAQNLVGKGVSALGGLGQQKSITDLIVPNQGNVIQRAGQWLQNDAQSGLAKIEGENAPYKADHPIVNTAGEIGGNVVATMPVGGLIAKGVSAIPGVATAAPGLVNAIRTSGMSTGQVSGNAIADLATRAAGGAITGAASGELSNQGGAGIGAVIGGAMPIASKVAGMAGNAIGNAVRGGGVSPEVAALADRAKQLGINIPADRLVDSKPLNALAATLNYVPLSGRAGTEAAMGDQLNSALSRTFGQDSPNVTQALRKASSDLGSQFDTVLKSNSVKMTPAFQQELAAAADRATTELGPEQAAIIHKQVADIQTKAALTGEIDGQTAYNIKKTLDRIGDRNSSEAFYARDLKKALMGALNDSMAPADAQAFAKLRQQYGNMLDLQNLATNGAEGGVSIGRLANLKNIGNPDVQELADIAAQFMKTRENPHGAMQRLALGSGAAVTANGAGALPLLAGGIAAGRGANALLNSTAARNYVLGTGGPNALTQLLSNDQLAQLGYRAAPAALAGR